MSVFDRIPRSEIVEENDLAYAVWDIDQITDGHVLVITRRETPNWLTATDEERDAVMDLATQVMQWLLRSDDQIEGFNVGMNVGAVAGQTVPHLHLHIVPRRKGDEPKQREVGFGSLFVR